MDQKRELDDLRDARAVADVAIAMRQHADHNSSAAGYVVNEAVEHFWERPRATKQGYRKWPNWAVWSEKAKESWKTNGSGVGLTGEHVIPRKVVREHLLRLAADEALDEVAALAVLQRIKLVVLTEEEAASVAPKQAMPPGWSWADQDDWGRYEQLEPQSFTPFADGDEIVEGLVSDAPEEPAAPSEL